MRFLASWICRLTFAIVFSVIFFVGASAAELAVEPTGEKVCLIYYHFAKADPPLEQWARTAPTVLRSNEFQRQAEIDKEIARLQAEFTSLAEINKVRLNISMSFDDYDSSLGEYTLSGFGVQNFMDFPCFGSTRVNLRFENAIFAQSWPLSPPDAEQVLKRNKGSRNIVSVSSIDITGAEAPSQNSPLVLVGKVREVTILGVSTNARLGSYMVPDK